MYSGLLATKMVFCNLSSLMSIIQSVSPLETLRDYTSLVSVPWGKDVDIKRICSLQGVSRGMYEARNVSPPSEYSYLVLDLPSVIAVGLGDPNRYMLLLAESGDRHHAVDLSIDGKPYLSIFVPPKFDPTQFTA